MNTTQQTETSLTEMELELSETTEDFDTTSMEDGCCDIYPDEFEKFCNQQAHEMLAEEIEQLALAEPEPPEDE